jgi:hypothetical protein
MTRNIPPHRQTSHAPDGKNGMQTLQSGASVQLRVMSAAQCRSNPAWLRGQLANLGPLINGLTPEDRVLALVNILIGVAWRGGE